MEKPQWNQSNDEILVQRSGEPSEEAGDQPHGRRPRRKPRNVLRSRRKRSGDGDIRTRRVARQRHSGLPAFIEQPKRPRRGQRRGGRVSIQLRQLPSRDVRRSSGKRVEPVAGGLRPRRHG